ncbi:hypothetical protein PF008_g2018 [Phytophthora fragariae]|uniref:Uncharacterized protein n=1 Tax=Phytophthora fragariae TaxID=53985 RepID=A0A6G0SJ52_9STRA|nr:hypothetical protein PF008_g2018 [Phytophthora fragariae]
MLTPWAKRSKMEVVTGSLEERRTHARPTTKMRVIVRVPARCSPTGLVHAGWARCFEKSSAALAARGSAGDASRTNPGEAAAPLQQSTVSTPEPLSTNAFQEGGSPNQSQSANASMMPIQSSSAPLPAVVSTAMGDQTGHVEFWNQASGGHVAQVTPLPGGGWGQAAPAQQPSQYVGSVGLVFGYGNGAPVPTPAAL